MIDVEVLHVWVIIRGDVGNGEYRKRQTVSNCVIDDNNFWYFFFFSRVLHR